jgi:hypothetical protein
MRRPARPNRREARRSAAGRRPATPRSSRRQAQECQGARRPGQPAGSSPS